MTPLQKKISRLALFDGAGLVVMGLLSLCAALIWKDAVGGMVGLALATLGGIELRGRGLLQMGEARATGWLTGSQIGLLFVILAYCLRGMAHPPDFSLNQLPKAALTRLETLPNFADSRSLLEETMPALLKVVYALAMLISIFYQGSMAMFYLRKTPLALVQPPPLPNS